MKFIALVRQLTGLLFVVCLVASVHSQEPSSPPAESKFDASWLSPLSFRHIGPALMSGRISDIAIDPNHSNTWYVAVGSGGLWKTTNSGTTWSPIFDSQASYSMGCVSIDPSNSNTIWVGTGENVGGRHVGVGDGIYVSHDGGKSWENKGLKLSEHISKIWIHPEDSNTVLVAAQGPLWSPNGERGLFKSTDGGANWKLVLSKGPYTGATDVVADPTNPDILYAAMHQRHRTVWALLNTGPESGIFKSTDGGESWEGLANGLPGEDKGKIALGVSPFDSHIVYATIELPNRTGGFWRSNDRGASWTKVSDFVSGGTGPHYYQEIYVDPHRDGVIYHANVVLMRSNDHGATWNSIEGANKHVDNHAVAFDPLDPEHILVGTDGGLYESNDFAQSFRFFPNLPLTQFYKIDVDYDFPFYNVIGGTQDNFTQYGPTRTRFVQGIRNSDWRQVVGGDGHDNAIDPTNPDILYGESQEGFIRRIDRKSEESVDIQPQPGVGEDALRFNWDSPILISPHNPTRIYFASRKLFRSDNRGDSWQIISPDLSRNQNRWALPIMGRVWGLDAGFDLLAMSQFGNITSISESPKVEGLIYVGTDDGLIHVTEDGGKSWTKIEKIYGVPEQAFVNDIKADRHDANTVYVCLDHHKSGDFKPYVLRSRDRGKNWESIAANLPDRHLVWRLEQDHEAANLLFLGTEYGVFVSVDSAANWHKLGGLPTISVRDLAIQKRENDLVAATFGRGIYVLDDYSPLRQMKEASFREQEAFLFPVRKTLWYQQADAFGGVRGFQGDEIFIAPNPTSGTVFTVFIKTAAKSKKATRQEAEQKARNENKDTPIPDWSALREENDEQPERIFLEIRDSSGRFLQRLDCPAAAGIHRISWDLNYSLPGAGVPILASPGTYKAQLRRLSSAGQLTDLGLPVDFVVESIVQSAVPGMPRAEVNAFLENAAKTQLALSETSSFIARLREELDGRSAVIASHAVDLQELNAVSRKIALRLDELNRKLVGDPVLESHFVRTPPSISMRIAMPIFSTASSLYGPTQTQRDQLAIGAAELDKLRSELDQVDKVEMSELRNRMNSAGLPWFPPAPPIQFEPQEK